MTFWTERKVRLLSWDGEVTVKGLVYVGCPGLAVTPHLTLDRHTVVASEECFKVSHVQSGRYIGWPIWSSQAEAKRFLLRLAPMMDWMTVRPENVRDKERLYAAINGIAEQLI